MRIYIMNLLSGLVSLSVGAGECIYSAPTVEVARQARSSVLKPEAYIKTIQNVDSVLCDFKKLSKLRVRISQSGNNAYYNFLNDEIQSVALFEKYESRKTGHPVHGLHILAHEYTHSVFGLNMNSDSKVFAKLRQSELKLVEYGMFMKELSEEYAEIGSDNELEEIVKVELESLQKYQSTPAYVMSRALNEFYADVVAIIVSQNPKAIYTSLKSEAKDKIMDSTMIRDFSQNYGSSVLSGWEKYANKLIREKQYSDLYYFGLAPLRGLTWELIKGPVQNPANHAKLAKAIYTALFEDFEQRFSKDIQFNQFDIKKYNIELEMKMKQKLSKAGF